MIFRDLFSSLKPWFDVDPAWQLLEFHVNEALDPMQLLQNFLRVLTCTQLPPDTYVLHLITLITEYGIMYTPCILYTRLSLDTFKGRASLYFRYVQVLPVFRVIIAILFHQS